MTEAFSLFYLYIWFYKSLHRLIGNKNLSHRIHRPEKQHNSSSKRTQKQKKKSIVVVHSGLNWSVITALVQVSYLPADFSAGGSSWSIIALPNFRFTPNMGKGLQKGMNGHGIPPQVGLLMSLLCHYFHTLPAHGVQQSSPPLYVLYTCHFCCSSDATTFCIHHSYDISCVLFTLSCLIVHV